ncbi:hypothetical protein RSOLAG22IIIB_12824 [Rhizoctonia solani]|uniref:Uncharacterized protein n=1 Tax=Rhizoctonia solani TaxID=456999 RepID=A0A0K6GGQ5_9AGAM|nr:hypothetical protein RSOLAG22IIIB_12824 [Rhizoctonia solani]
MSTPWYKRAAKVTGVGLGVGAAVFVAPPLLGFTTAGIAAGSIAAGIQSVVYGAAIPAGGWFATMQSIGATATVVPALMAGGGAAMGAMFGTENEDPDNSNGENNGGNNNGGGDGGGGNGGGGNGGSNESGPAKKKKKKTGSDGEKEETGSDEEAIEKKKPESKDKNDHGLGGDELQQSMGTLEDDDPPKIGLNYAGKHNRAVFKPQ